MVSSDSQLNDQVALITGGGTGIGLMIAQAFASSGAKVYITGRRLQVLKDAIDSSGPVTGSFVPLQLDVVDEDAVRGAAKFIEDTDGRLDILVNNAGITGPLLKKDEFKTEKLTTSDPTRMEPEVMADWMDLFKLNTIAPFFIIRAFTKLLVKGAEVRGLGATSSVINVSSAAGSMKSVVSSSTLGYGPSKAALDQLTVTLASLFASTDVPIRVNGISPGVFPSQLSTMINSDGVSTRTVPGLVNPIPAKRAGRKDEMGATALYLATTEYTNGIILKVDGGISLVNP